MTPRDVYPVYLKLITLFPSGSFSVLDTYHRLNCEIGISTIAECLNYMVELGFLKVVDSSFSIVPFSALPADLVLQLNCYV